VWGGAIRRHIGYGRKRLQTISVLPRAVPTVGRAVMLIGYTGNAPSPPFVDAQPASRQLQPSRGRFGVAQTGDRSQICSMLRVNQPQPLVYSTTFGIIQEERKDTHPPCNSAVMSQADVPVPVRSAGLSRSGSPKNMAGLCVATGCTIPTLLSSCTIGVPVTLDGAQGSLRAYVWAGLTIHQNLWEDRATQSSSRPHTAFARRRDWRMDTLPSWSRMKREKGNMRRQLYIFWTEEIHRKATPGRGFEKKKVGRLVEYLGYMIDLLYVHR
jgi:hypothetical protein